MTPTTASPQPTYRGYAVLDEALELLSPYGPDLRNGLTSHAPMVAEALCALDRPEAVLPWLERYRPGLLPRPAVREPIAPGRWRQALGEPARAGDWSARFAQELAAAPWPEVLDRWVRRLAPGLCASATHGVIRVGHAARGLARGDTPLRRGELAEALASWASTYQELPTREGVGEGALAARDALAKVVPVPPARRRFAGTITSALGALDAHPDFAPVIGLPDLGGDPASRVAELVEVFAGVLLANARDVLGAIVFVHGVTSVAAVGNLLPHIAEPTAHTALRYAWQAGCGLYAAFGSRPAPDVEVEPSSEDAEALVERTLAHGDEHAIKLTEACLSHHARHGSPACLAAAHHALALLPRR